LSKHRILGVVVSGLTLTGLAAAALSSNGPESLPTAVDAGWKGKKVCEVLTDSIEMRVARCTFPPGGGHERHSHPPHWGYILAGSTMQMTDAGGTVTRELNAGASWWSDGTEWHEVLNVGDTTGVYLIVEPNQKTGSD